METEISKVDIHQQQYAHFGRLNDILYKIPPFLATIIGGLWFFAVSYKEDKAVSVVVFLFAAVCCACFSMVLINLRSAFNAYLDNINKMDGDMSVNLQNNCWPSTICCFVILLIGGLIISISAAFYVLLK